MIGYVGVDEQVDRDFHRALWRASLHRLRDRVLRRSGRDHVLSFEEARSALRRWSQAYRGMRTVEVEKIVGSVGRCQDFDESFLPVRISMSGRWGRVDRAYHQGVELPAVSLFKIGKAYFVVDGNHRVSVARYHGVAAIDAEVIELRGHMLRSATQSTPREAEASLQEPQDDAQPRSSWLHSVWQHLRPDLSAVSSSTP